MSYDNDNVFYKIIHGEIQSKPVLEGKHYIAINDISPKEPIHVLVISKGSYTDWYDFVSNASSEEIADINDGIKKVIEMSNLRDNGYQIVINSGTYAEIRHLHIHVMGKLNY